MSRRAWRWVIVIVAAWVALAVAPRLLGLYTDWLWFQEVGYWSVFWTVLKTKVGLGALLGLGFFVLAFGNAYLARRLAPRTAWYEQERAFRQQVAEVMEAYVGRYLFITLLLVLLWVSYLVGRAGAEQWHKWLWFLNATPFGTKDPIFGRDLSFYVFRLPFLEYLWQWVYGALIAVLIIAAAVHYFDKAIRVLGGVPAFAPHVKAHLSVLLGAILLVKAIGYKLDSWQLLFSPHGMIYGASYTDVNARLPAYNILLVIALISAVLVLVNMRFRGLWLPLLGIGILFVSSMIVNSAYPALVQRVQVIPNEQEREKPYIQNHIKFTRQA